MLSGFEHFIAIAKYILMGLAAIGVITLGVGLYQRQQQIIVRGAYMLILALVFAVCGYLIYEATVDKAEQIIYDTYMEYNNQ